MNDGRAVILSEAKDLMAMATRVLVDLS